MVRVLKPLLLLTSAVVVFVPWKGVGIQLNEFQMMDRRIVSMGELALDSDLRSANIWSTVLKSTQIPAPWLVEACPGSAPLLCVADQGTLVGTVEMGTYLLDSRADFKQRLQEVGISPGQINEQDPQYRAKVEVALQGWIADYYQVFKSDRQKEYGSKITFKPETPQQVSVGKLLGMRYGFSGIDQNREVHEQHIGYVAFDGKMLYVITTAYDPASETGKFPMLKNFRRFEPYLRQLVANLQLPFQKSGSR